MEFRQNPLPKNENDDSPDRILSLGGDGAIEIQ